MDGIIPLLIIAAIALLVSGPVALIISSKALSKIRDLDDVIQRQQAQLTVLIRKLAQMEKQVGPQNSAPSPPQAAVEPQPISPPPEMHEPPVIPRIHPSPVPQPAVQPHREPIAASPAWEQAKIEQLRERVSWEVSLGTRWLAIAGAIVMTIGVIFGLKYLYDNAILGPLGRTLCVTGWGLAAIAIGQVTRVRGYGIVAKSLTALGFAMLYAAVFAAFGLYKLIGAEAAFVLAIVVTAGGLCYAAMLDEVVMAFLSLLGGFLSPVMLSTGQDRPHALFGYISILSVGAMLTAVWRKWRSVNALAFAGTVILYAAWYSKYYSFENNFWPAIIWLAVSFVIFLTLPVIYELSKRTIAKREDVGLILANAMYTLGFLSAILYRHYNEWLALGCAIMAGAHFAMMYVVHLRSQQDKALKTILMLIGISLVTLATGIYFEMYGLGVAYIVEFVILTAIAVNYRSVLSQISSIAVAGLAVGVLLNNLPLHSDTFKLVFNPQCGAWLLAAVAFYAAHFIYRKAKDALPCTSELMQAIFCASLVMLLAAVSMEWYLHCKYNLYEASELGWHGVLVCGAAVMLLALLPKFKPAGIGPFELSWALAAGVFSAMAVELGDFDRSYFQYVNSCFVSGCIVSVSFYIASLLYYKRITFDGVRAYTEQLVQLFFLVALVLLMLAINYEWYGHRSRFSMPLKDMWYLRGLLVILCTFGVTALLPQFSPKGVLPVLFSILIIAGAMILSLHRLENLDSHIKYVYLNSGFIFALLPAITAGLCGYIISKRSLTQDLDTRKVAFGLVLAIILFVWLVLTKEMHWYWKHHVGPLGTGEFNIDKGQMWISIVWAIYAALIMAIGLWRKIIAIRYIAFGLITILLLKLFLFDTMRLGGLYKIGSFVMLGAVLIALSYLYQYLRKKGFFEAGADNP